MTDDLQQSRIEAAAQAMSDGYVTSGRQVLSWVELAEVALAAADAHLPAVEQIAEAQAGHDLNLDKCTVWTPEAGPTWICRCGRLFHERRDWETHRANVVLNLFLETQEDENDDVS